MRRIILVVGAVLGIVAGTHASADSVNGKSASGTAALAVVKSLSVTQTTGLDFGTITSGLAGAVSIYPVAQQRGVTGGVGAVSADNGQPGAFLVAGDFDAEVNIVIGATIDGFSGGITGVTRHSPLLPRLQGFTQVFTVGGTLSIPAKTAAGRYAGAFTVTVNYP